VGVAVAVAVAVDVGNGGGVGVLVDTASGVGVAVKVGVAVEVTAGVTEGVVVTVGSGKAQPKPVDITSARMAPSLICRWRICASGCGRMAMIMKHHMAFQQLPYKMSTWPAGLVCGLSLAGIVLRLKNRVVGSQMQPGDCGVRVQSCRRRLLAL
jgi:hypothetical protein